MFKVPDWGDDVPNVKVNFGKKNKKSNKQQRANPVESNNTQNTIKKKKRKNKNQVNDTAEAKNVKVYSNGPSFVSTKINGAVNKKSFKKKISADNNNTNFNKSNDEIKINKKPKLKKKINKRPHTDNADGDETIISDNDQNIPKKGKKRKKTMAKNNIEGQDNTNLDAGIKRKKFDDQKEIDDQDLLFGHNNKSRNKTKKKNDAVKVKINSKKEKIKQLLETQLQRTPIVTSGNKLRDRMLERLKAAQFRYINEKLYTSSGSDAQQLFSNDPAAFQTYHQGYQQQVKKWPVNPLDIIVKRIQKMPKTHKIADMGCGEAALSKRIQHPVRSFDLVATSPAVEVCDIAHTPLLSESMDATVYCLALMGTDLTQYLVEANRVLKVGGHLLIAEVESRFNKVEDFTKEVERLGFKLKNLDKTHQVFFFIEFTKVRDAPVKKSKLPVLTLKPCLYKRR